MEKNKRYFPLFADLSEKKILVVGGGNIASRRVHTLRPFCDFITVVAPEIGSAIVHDQATCVHRAFCPEDLEGMDLVIVATNVPETDRWIHALCKQRNIPVNVAGDKNLCDFYFPGIIREDSVVVGVTASGSDHKKVKEIRQQIEESCFHRKKDEKGKDAL